MARSPPGEEAHLTWAPWFETGAFNTPEAGVSPRPAERQVWAGPGEGREGAVGLQVAVTAPEQKDSRKDIESMIRTPRVSVFQSALRLSIFKMRTKHHK